MAEELSVQQGTEGGPATSLSQGAASEVNAALPQGTVSEGQMLDEGLPTPIDYPTDTEATSGGPVFSPTSDDEQILFGDPDSTEPTLPELPSGRLPDSVVRWLQTMRAAANESTAPDSLRAIYAAAVNSLDAELR